MPTIECTLQGFGSSRTPSQSVPGSLLDLLFTAATVGMPTLASHPASARPLLEMQWRMAIVAANLRITDGGKRWGWSDAYDQLVPSEKTSVNRRARVTRIRWGTDPGHSTGVTLHAADGR